MKNKIYYLGIAACLLTSCGCMFKIMHWTGAGIILVIGFVTLGLVFLPLALSSIVKAETNKKQKVFYTLVAMIMAIDFIGILFKIMHWPGAGWLLMINITLPFVILLPAYLISTPADKEINYKNFMAMMFFFAWFAAITAFLSIRVSADVVAGFNHSAINIEEKTIGMDENTKLLITMSEKDSISTGYSSLEKSQITAEADKLCRKIDEIKRLITIIDSNNDRKILKNGDKVGLSEKKYMDTRPNIETRYLTELKTGINDYKALLQKQCNPGSPLYNYLNEVFNTANSKDNDESWENGFLKDKILASSIESLDLLEFRVRLAANETIALFLTTNS